MTSFVRIGATRLTKEVLADGSTTLTDDDTLFFTSLPGAIRVLASDESDALIEVSKDDVTELWLIYRDRVGFEQTLVTTTTEQLVVGAISKVLAATASNSRKLSVFSAVPNPLESAGVSTLSDSITLPVIGTGIVRCVRVAVHLSPMVVAVSIGSGVALYSVSNSFKIDPTYRLVSFPLFAKAVPTVSVVIPLDDRGDMWAATLHNLILRCGDETVQVNFPKFIGSPILDIVCIRPGLVVVGPNGIWGVSFKVHATKRMYGRRFVVPCYGLFGAVPTFDGDGVMVWTNEEFKRETYLLTDLGFRKW